MDEFLNKLNKKQQEAVIHTDGPLLIFAGAGSGKTRVLTYKIAYLLQKKKTTPNRILAVTFTNKAAKEMKKRVKNLLGFKSNYVDIGTFHSINARILREEKRYFMADFTIYDSTDSLNLIKESIKALGLNSDIIKAKAIKHFINNAKQQLILPEDAKKYFEDNFINEQNIKIYTEYQKRLMENNAVDFDDLLIQPLILFKKHRELKQKYQNKWDYILVDEYQDTNHVQFLFLKTISQVHNNICVVGDDDQSIYKWRGADIKNILEFEKAFKNSKIIKLEQNYRSTKNILLAASSVVGNNILRKKKKIWADSEDGEKLIFKELEGDYAEADFVAETIIKKVDQGAKYKDFAILYRTNAQSRLIEEALRNRSIRYTIVGGTKFYERKEVKDILAYLNFFTNPNDSLSLKRIINVPPRGIGKTTIDRLEKFGNNTNRTLFETLQYPDEVGASYAKSKTEKFLKTMLNFQNEIDKNSPSEFVFKLIDKVNFKEQYQDESEFAQDKIANIDEFINSVLQFEKNNEGATIVNFLQEVSLITDIDQWNDETDMVVLMTLHSAKGLEFPTVFIVGMEEGLFPLERSKENREELEEERRLFYVGITRAMENVYLTSAQKRMRFGQFMHNMTSQFIEEIPNECIIHKNFSNTKSQNTNYFKHENYTNKFYKKQPKRYNIDTKQNSGINYSKSKKIKINDSVYHKIFGKGKIVAISKSSQIAYKVLFNNQTIKIIAAKYLKKM